MEIRRDNLQHPQVIELIRAHLDAMAPTAPDESRHALDIDGLRGPDITFWSVWDDQKLAGIGALKQLSSEHAEIKSMKTAKDYLRRGIASALLSHLIREATNRGYKQLSLETGSMAFFEPARKLYSLFGFMPCAPFADYVEDPNSVFMSKQLNGDKNAASEK
ncbi:GNAT family N-acetyltransferase [Lacimicrobium alkaliphilum]|uniref:N-acetyltransferase domain-containing protein n=1 Tax=Lacimicrobium alkaliphilum TaxID=1526571 RepID=A0A0U3A7A2_9ALTE|nr:GNAT family N-acetyltransferase [Lacimicrobium alkaliphilum]ALS96862.1 hypothetical protein AT746_00275 [Lacimicrobium alkaliphilum]